VEIRPLMVKTTKTMQPCKVESYIIYFIIFLNVFDVYLRNWENGGHLQKIAATDLPIMVNIKRKVS